MATKAKSYILGDATTATLSRKGEATTAAAFER
jgi:hypothetical protein